jgi:hypothetical protein
MRLHCKWHIAEVFPGRLKSLSVLLNLVRATNCTGCTESKAANCLLISAITLLEAEV